MRLNSINTNLLFRIGVFFLATAPFISFIFFISFLISSFLLKKSINLFEDKFNIPFLFGMITIIISATYQYFNSDFISQGWDRNLSFIGFLIGFIFIFLYSFPRLFESKKSREIFVLCLITGSIPVLISVILSVFGIYGPFSTLNGLIVWYQRPIIRI